MKNSVLLVLVFLSFLSATAQTFHVYGKVTSNGAPVANYPLYIQSDDNTPAYSKTIYTDAAGLYQDTILDGAAAGLTRKWFISTDTASTSFETITKTFNNNQGENDSARINFRLANLVLAKKKDKETTVAFQATMEAYPNPFTDILMVSVEANKKAIAKINFRSLIGGVVKTYTEEIEVGSNKIKLQVQDLQDGIYFVEIICNDKKLVKKLIKN